MPELAEPPLLDARAGANRYEWNLRLRDPKLVEDAVVWGSTSGPLVPPGTYRARLTVGDWSDTVEFQVVPDPRLELGQQEVEERYEVAVAVWRQLERSHDAIRVIRSVRDQVEAIGEGADGEQIQEATEALAKALTGIEQQLHHVDVRSSQDMLNFPPRLGNQLVFLLEVVESALGEPTRGSRDRLAELEAELDRLEGELDGVLDERLIELERLLEDEDVPRVVVDR
jgi:hypothetical protein